MVLNLKELNLIANNLNKNQSVIIGGTKKRKHEIL